MPSRADRTPGRIGSSPPSRKALEVPNDTISTPRARSDGQTPSLLVSLATFNEAGNLRDLVAEVRKFAPHAAILVVDDGSPDGTGAIAEELAASLPEVYVLQRGGKQGLGTAILAAMQRAIAGGYDYYVNLDADFSHPPRYLPALLAGMDDADVMIGSRYVPGGEIEGEFGLKRKLMSGGINLYARAFLGLKTRDNSGSYRCYRVSKLAEIDLSRVRSRGYSFMEEILYLCRQIGCRFGETPIRFENRRAGVSKINKAEAAKALGIIFRLGIGRLFDRSKPGRPAGPTRTPNLKAGSPTRPSGSGVSRD